MKRENGKGHVRYPRGRDARRVIRESLDLGLVRGTICKVFGVPAFVIGRMEQWKKRAHTKAGFR